MACATDDYPALVAAPPGANPPSTEAAPSSEPASPSESRIKAPPTESLIGKAGSDLVALLGRPGLVHKEKGAEVWQYAGGACVMLFYLYDDPTGARRVTYLESVPQGATSAPSNSGVGATPQTCLAYQMLAASGRPLS